MIVRILPAAEAELEAIGDYIARDNRMRSITDAPQRGMCGVQHV
jgi:plasmid stabilization system protein ParE